MAIDIKELRIGNHVLLDGEKVKIVTLDADHFDKYISIGVKNEQGDVWIVSPNDIQPIPITEELLTELGFEKDNDLHFDYAKRFENKLSFFITLHDNGGLRIEVWDNHIHKGNMICRFLHEMESFIYLTTNKELI